MKKNNLLPSKKMLPEALPDGVQIISAPIEAVCISEDRAEIRRTADISLLKGQGTVFVDDITVFAHDPSLSVLVDSPVAPEIGNARIIRYYVAPGGDYRLKEQALLKKLDALAEQYQGMLDERKIDRHKAAALQKALRESREGIVREIVHCKEEDEGYKTRLEQLLSRFSGLLDNDLRWHLTFRDLIEKIEILVREAQEDPGLIGKRAGILIRYASFQAGEGQLTIRYEVPCAQWRPFHEAHLLQKRADSEKVLLITHGAVWQNTGEDWHDAKITLSTARPSLGLELPLPVEDFLKVREKTKEERKQIRVAIRDEVIKDTGLTGDYGPGVPDDDGQTQNYTAPARVTIPADGQPYMVELHRFESKSKSSLMAAPELSDRVFLRSQLEASNRPILSGPVELYRNGGFLGKGFIDFVGPAEPFYLYWGSEDFVQLVRWVDTDTDKGKVITKSKQIYTVNLLIRNINNEPVDFTLIERIPVSELEQVQVKIFQLPNNAKPDKDGFVRSTVNVPPLSEEKLIFKYSLVIDKNVVM